MFVILPVSEFHRGTRLETKINMILTKTSNISIGLPHITVANPCIVIDVTNFALLISSVKIILEDTEDEKF